MAHPLALLVVLLGCGGDAFAQSFPAKPVRIVTGSAGTFHDIVTRQLGDRLGKRWGHAVVVENNGAAGMTIGTGVVARAAPDGYTLVMSDRSALAVAPHLQKSLPYDVEKDFAPISLVALAPPILVVHPAFPAHTLRALMAYVREHPGEVSYASAGPGTATHVAAELLKHLAQLDMVAVHYKGGGAAIAAIVSGEVPVGTALVPAVLPHIKSGRVRPLAVAADKRFAGLPEIPTAAQAGLAGFESQFWIGLLAPARTPGPLVSRLNADVGAVLRTEEFRAVLLSQGADAAPGTPAEFAQLIRTEMQRMKNLVALTRMRAD